MDEKRLNEEMMNVIYSDEAKEAFDKDLKGMDSKAFTEEGKVHSYEIVRESIRRNPMGGINVELIINNDSEMGNSTRNYSDDHFWFRGKILYG